MKKLLLIVILLMLSSAAKAQFNPYNYGLIGKLQRDSAIELESGNQIAAGEMYEKIIAIYKIEEGLYSTSAIDLMFQLRTWAEEVEDYEEAIKWSYMAHFAVLRNQESDHAMFNKLIHSNIYTPSNAACFERDDERIIRFQKNNEDCKKHRYYRADSIIRAVELQQHVIENLVATKTELLFLYTLSEMAIGAVYGVGGEDIIIKYDPVTDTLRTEYNSTIPNRYRWNRYLTINKNILDDISRMVEDEAK